jgi:3-hydroxy-9,10-secoandrosta-1,3,5(10)-triene-9,17-dione monooxygenase
MLEPGSFVKLSRSLRRQVAATEKRRRLSASAVKAMSDLGVFRALVPACYGGLESGLAPLFDGLMELAKGCAATAWVGSLMSVHSAIAAWYPEVAQQRVWSGGPDARIGSSFAPMGRLLEVPHGVLLSGRWSFVSGVDHSDWLMLGARRKDQHVLLLVPFDRSVQVTDDWHVMGLAGSGSKSLQLDGVFVPEEQILSMALVQAGQTPGVLQHRSALYRLPWRPLFSYAFIPPLLGCTQAALEECRAYFLERRSAYTDQAFKDRGLALAALASSQGEWNAAMALLREDLQALEAGPAQEPFPHSLVARASFHPALIARLCRDSVNRLYFAGGGSVLYSSHPLQRRYRDVVAMAQHPAVNYEMACEAYGKALLEP